MLLTHSYLLLFCIQLSIYIEFKNNYTKMTIITPVPVIMKWPKKECLIQIEGKSIVVAPDKCFGSLFYIYIC